jgi:hypothetical protein
MTSGRNRAVVLHAPSDGQAELGERDLRQVVRRGLLDSLVASGLAAGEVDKQKLARLVDTSVVLRGFQVVAYFSRDPNALVPSRRQRAAFNECV